VEHISKALGLSPKSFPIHGKGGTCEFDRKVSLLKASERIRRRSICFEIGRLRKEVLAFISLQDSTASLRECTRARGEQFLFKLGETGSAWSVEHEGVFQDSTKGFEILVVPSKHVCATTGNLLGLGRFGRRETTCRLRPSRE
jgi:hypothetical protein